MAKKEGEFTYRVISRMEISLPVTAGAKTPLLQVTWEFPGHAPRILYIPKDQWTEAKEDDLIRAEIQKIRGRTPAAVR